jgi:hypothetical protein
VPHCPRQIGRRADQIRLPPEFQNGIVDGFSQSLGVDTQMVLMSQVVKASAAFQMLLQLGGRSGDQSWPGLHEQIAQLKAARAIHIVLQAALAELKRLR